MYVSSPPSPFLVFPLVYRHSDRPDIIVLGMGVISGIDVAELLHIPFVINNPSTINRLGLSPIHVPAWGSGFSESMTLFQRAANALYPKALELFLSNPLTHINHARTERNLSTYETQWDIFRDKLVMVNSAFGFECAQSLPPLVKLTGPLMPSHRLAADYPLPESITSWLDFEHANSNTDGTIIVVLLGRGTMTHLSDAATQKLAAVLASTGSRILWALDPAQHDIVSKLTHSRTDSESEATPPTQFQEKSQFMLHADFPQLPVIAHTAVKLVISPCGLGTAQETLYYGKPLLCIPMYGDQFDISARVVDRQAGLSISIQQATPTQLSAAIHTLLEEPSYRTHAKSMSKIFQVSGGCTTAADIVETTITTGTSHLRSLTDKLPWHQQSNADVLVLLLSFAFVTVVGLSFVTKIMCRKPPTWLSVNK
jgi:UDP-glucoronosyl and UDP-glucosyl transferase